MYAFDYDRPQRLADAVAALAADPDAKPVAGGQSLLPMMKQRLAAPSRLVDVSGLDELRGLQVADGVLRIGALTRHCEVAASPVVRSAIPALAHLASVIGDVQVRHRGTIGGSVANNDPAADYPAACLGLGATIVTDRRRLSADGFSTGLFETVLEPDELIVAVEFPLPAAAAYRKFRHPVSRYALVGVFVARTAGGVRVAVTGAGPSVFRVTDYEARLDAAFAPASIADRLVDETLLNADIHASAAYRAHMIRHLAQDAVAEIS